MRWRQTRPKESIGWSAGPRVDRGRVHLKTTGQALLLSELRSLTGAGVARTDLSRHQTQLLGDGVGCVSLTDFRELQPPGETETMAPQGSRAPLEFGGPLGNGAEKGAWAQRPLEGNEG